MRQLLHVLLKWVGQRFVWFLLILAVLTGGAYLKSQVDNFEASRTELAALKSGKQDIDSHLGALEQALHARIKALEKASLTALDTRIKEIDRELVEKRAAQNNADSLPLLLRLAAGQSIAGPLRRDIEIQVLAQERDHLDGLRLVAAALIERDRGVAELERLRRAHAQVYARLGASEQALAHIKSAHPVAIHVPGAAPREMFLQAQAAYEALYAQNQQAFEVYERQRVVVAAFKIPAVPPGFRLQREAFQPTLTALDETIRRLETSPLLAVWERALGFVPAALGLLLGVMLLPLLIKAFFYFVLAPIAARRPPVHLLPAASGLLEVAGASAISQALVLRPGDELLIDPAYVQSAALGGDKRTAWLLDWWHPFTSLASGMYALTRIRSSVPESIVVSATADPLSEVSVMALPRGAAFVLQPRSLAGVMQPRDTPLRITSHWRLGTLHGWLTLQLRYLVFHGPATLIVKGCRGVRVEAAGAGDAGSLAAPRGRRISQAATIGFSANLRYATTRVETFYPYLTGKQGLLDDSFSGGPGYYAYEEVPHGGARAGVGGRGLEGFTDSVLKVFGI